MPHVTKVLPFKEAVNETNSQNDTGDSSKMKSSITGPGGESKWGLVRKATVGQANEMPKAATDKTNVWSSTFRSLITSDAAKFKQSEVKATLRIFVETTSVKGVAKVAKSKSITIRILWIIAVLAGLSIAIWQITNLLLRFFQYGTITNLSICHKCHAPFPDVTVCNLNPLSSVSDFGLESLNEYLYEFSQRSQAVLYDQAALGQLLTAVDMTFDETVNLYNELFSVAGYFQNINVTKFDESLETFGNNLLVHDCNWYDWEQKPYTQENCRTESIFVNYNPSLLMCYTMHMKEINPGTDADDVGGLSAILYVNDFAYDSMPKFSQSLHASQSRGVRVLIHARNTYPDITQGFDVAPGKDISINLNSEEWKHIGLPYQVCTEEKYLENNDNNDGIKYEYSVNSAFSRCQQEENIKRCGCFSPHLPITPELEHKYGDLPPCGILPDRHPHVQNLIHSAVNVACYYKAAGETNDTEADLEKQCAFDQPCHEYRYSLSKTITDWPHESYQRAFYTQIINITDNRRTKFGDKFDVYENISLLIDTNLSLAFEQLRNQDLISRNFLQLKVQFKQGGLMVYTDVPSVTMDSFFGTMGGVLNLWIGITFFTVVELVDLCYKLISISWKQRKEKENTDSKKSNKI